MSTIHWYNACKMDPHATDSPDRHRRDPARTAQGGQEPEATIPTRDGLPVPGTGGHDVDGEEPFLKTVISKAEDRREEGLAALEGLARATDCAKLFVATAANLAIAPADLINEVDFGSVPAKLELLAYNLWPHLKAVSGTDVTPYDTNACIDALDKVFDTRLFAGLKRRLASHGDRRRDVAEQARAYAESVRGSAYPEQTARDIREVQGRFEGWFKARVGLGPRRAADLLSAIMKAQQEAVDGFMSEVDRRADEVAAAWEAASTRPPSERDGQEKLLCARLADRMAAWTYGRVEALNRLAPECFPVSRVRLAFLAEPPSEAEWEALLSMLGFSQEVRAGLSGPASVQEYPLFVLPNGRVLLADIANAMDALWRRLEEAARADPKFNDRYQKHKADWLEGRAVACLARLFPPESVYASMSYPDPDRDGRAVAELDAAVRWGPFLVLVEAKAKQFRLEGQLGDVGRLASDFRANVEAAFEQARRAARYVASVPEAVFREAGSGRELRVRGSDLRRTYLLTVSRHHLGGLATQLRSLQALGLFRDGELPLATSLSDLELVTEFSEGPDVFIHYLERRLALQRDGLTIYADDLDLFDAYLETRLRPERLWDREEQRPDAVTLLGWSEPFDRLFMYRRGEIADAPDIRLAVPEEVSEVLAELRRRDEDDARWIAFALLGLSDQNLGAVAEAFRRMRANPPLPGRFRSLVVGTESVVITVVATADLPTDRLEAQAGTRAMIEKYRHKADWCVGFGIHLRPGAPPFWSIVWGEGTWAPDPVVEAVIAEEPRPVRLPGQPLPGRNDPCLCGSGRKFKRCCLRRIEADGVNPAADDRT